MQVEDVKTALLLHGARTSQVTKDVLADIHKLRTVDADHASITDSWPQAACTPDNRTTPLNLHHFSCMQREAVRLSRKNDKVRPFETGGEVELEYLVRRADTGVSCCSLILATVPALALPSMRQGPDALSRKFSSSSGGSDTSTAEGLLLGSRNLGTPER